MLEILTLLFLLACLIGSFIMIGFALVITNYILENLTGAGFIESIKLVFSKKK